MPAARRDVLVGLASAGFLGATPRTAATDAITPEAFGAKGDGRTNDSQAFAAMSKYVNARGGGTVVLRPVTYLVGRQGDQAKPTNDSRSGEFSFRPAPIIQFVNCRAPVVLRGNGAILRAAPGLRFGSFDPLTGRPFHPPLPFVNRKYRASPYLAMIYVQGCHAVVDIDHLELDGNLSALEIGGKWGAGGWQIPGSGVQLIDNSAPERISRLYSHHHPLDGLMIKSSAQRALVSLISDVTCDYNGRQGCTITGGQNYSFTGCKFRHTGKGGLRSKPGAGVDIEAEKPRTVRDVSFSGCEFSDNASVGVGADSGDSLGVTFDYCTFVGTTNWAIWPNKPRMRFTKCVFVGSIVRAFGDPNPARATQFDNCKFLDDPRFSPTGEVYCGTKPPFPIVVFQARPNVRFNRCEFTLTHRCSLPRTTIDIIYSDCRMSQQSAAQSRPIGTYLGTNVISGNADIQGSIIRGDVILNGRRSPRT